jgi:hypothetical protein
MTRLPKSIPYPVQAAHLEAFTHPAEASAWHRIRSWDGGLILGNGWLALRVHRGAFDLADYPAASAEFLSRWGKIPWTRWGTLAASTAWRATHDVAGEVFKRPFEMWLDSTGTRAPSPTWSVASIPVPANLFQALARLPRCEVFTGAVDPTDPLWFRFSGGCGALARARAVAATGISRSFFQPRRCSLTGDTLRDAPTPPPAAARPASTPLGRLPGWPPPTPLD